MLKVFRFNLDLIHLYKIRFDATGFEISDPIGRTATSRNTSKAYWRKVTRPFIEGNDETSGEYVDEELFYALREILNVLWLADKLVLVEPYAENRIGKLMQMQLAAKYFSVPQYEFLYNAESALKSDRIVAKSLSGATLGGKVIYTTEVRCSSLDTAFPWFLEACVDAKYDVTVVVVRDQIFSFRLDRDFRDKSLDWREFIGQEQRWESVSLSQNHRQSILTLMAEVNLHYARFDFLMDSTESMHFCELNPNGQFAWLDLEDRYGLLSAVTYEISPETPCTPIPQRHVIS